MTQLCVFWPGVTCPVLVSFPVFMLNNCGFISKRSPLKLLQVVLL